MIGKLYRDLGDESGNWRVAAARGGLFFFEHFDAIAKFNTLERLPTGIFDLDLQLDKGLARKQLGVWLGDAGGGKSISLVTQAAEGVRRNIFTGFITLELPEAIQMARLYANLTGVPTNEIIRNDAMHNDCVTAFSNGDALFFDPAPHSRPGISRR